MSSPRTIQITVAIPSGADVEETVIFCVGALTSWGGQRHPDDPLFGSVRIKKIKTSGRSYALLDDGSDLVYADTEKEKPSSSECSDAET